MLLKGEVLLPQLAIVDASLSESTPQSVTATTGLDALTHAIEAYTSKQAQPLTDALAVSAVKRIFSLSPAAYRDGKNRKAREEMAAAALEAGICINKYLHLSISPLNHYKNKLCCSYSASRFS